MYGIIRQNGGAVNVESAVGQGSTVALFFPAVTPQPAAARRSPSDITVFVVDDNPGVRDVASRTLIREGYRVVTCSGPLEALARLDEGSDIGVLVSDISMPEHSGRWLAEQMRLRRPMLAVLFLTGYAEASPTSDLPPRTMVLGKPFDPSTLAAAVADLAN